MPAACSASATLRLSGMFCAACSGVVEQALKQVDGVGDAVVHFATQRASVHFDAARADAAVLIAAVRRAGYDAAPDRPDAARTLRRAESRRALWRLFVAWFCAMQVMMLATPGYVADAGDIAPDLQRLLDLSAWVVALPVLLFSASPFFGGAWRALRARRIGMDIPLALGIAVTFIASSGAVFDPAGPFGSAVYFDSLTMFVSFLLLGRWLEMRLRHRAEEALEAATGALPETALRLRADGAADDVVPVGALAVGDRVRVPLGAAFPADGVLVEGASAADESLLTGEAAAVAKPLGAHVVAASVNVGVPVVMRVQRCGADTRYEAIAALLRDAALQRPASARWAERWAAPFLWTVLALAAAAAAVWSVIDPPRAVWVAVSVLIVTCPCALSLATPSALLAAAQALARRGVLLRRSDALETLAGIDRLFFDKTGTLTSAQPRLARVEPLAAAAGADTATLLRAAASLAAWSTHPLSRALCAEALPCGAGGLTPTWHGAREQTGAGVEARDVQRRLWRLGSAAWVGALPAGDAAQDDSDRPAVWLGRDGAALLCLRFDEAPADGARAAIDALRADGVAVTLLSGDAPARVQRLARRLGIDADSAVGGATPERKLLEVQLAQACGERVGMVGDGINDAPVLARADVSLAMGDGALIARASADAVLVSNRIADIVDARRLARRTMTIVRQNIAWAATYNAVCVPLALAGMLPPWAAGLGMAASSLAVVGNSLRLQR